MLTCQESTRAMQPLMTQTERAHVLGHLMRCPACRERAAAMAAELIAGLSTVHALSALRFAYRQAESDFSDADFNQELSAC